MTVIERIGGLPGPLKISCTGCGWSVTWAKPTAIRLLGGWRQVYDARVVLICSVCRTKGRVSFDTGPHLIPASCRLKFTVREI